MKLVAIIAIGLLLAACGGGKAEGATLHLRGYDISAENYESHLRQGMLGYNSSTGKTDAQLVLGFELTCKAIRGTTPARAHEILNAGETPTENPIGKDGKPKDDGIYPKGAIPKPKQLPQYDSQLKAMEIALKVCA